MSLNELTFTTTLTSSTTTTSTNTKPTIQEIAFKITEEQLKTQQQELSTLERTIFVLGSKGVGKTTIINNFLDRQDTTIIKPTLALEYSYGRRTNSGHGIEKQICNIWELGSLLNSYQLIDIPIKSHGLENFVAIIILDISQPERLWSDLEITLNGLKQSIKQNYSQTEIDTFKIKSNERIGLQHPDLNTLELFPIPLLIIGGNYDKFQDLDPEVKKHVCRCLRSISHTIGASLIYYSVKNQALAKSVRDTFNHFGFGSPMHPFRTTAFDYNGPLLIWYGKDSWSSIGVTPTNSERIGLTYSTQIPQLENLNENNTVAAVASTIPNDPAKDPGFREAIIDEMRAQKDEELLRLLKDTEIRAKFQTIIT